MTEQMWIILIAAIVGFGGYALLMYFTAKDPLNPTRVDSTPMYFNSQFSVEYSFSEPNDPQYGIVKGWDKDRNKEILTEPQPSFKYLKGDVVKYKYIGVQTTNVKIVE